MSFLGIGGKKKTEAYTSMSTLWGDKVVPYSGGQAIFDYIMHGGSGVSVTGKTIPDYMMDYYNRSLPPKMRKIKKTLDVDPNAYYYGDLKSKFIINNDAGVDLYFQNYLDSLVGHTITEDYDLFGEINNSHAAWDIFKRLYGYNPVTNQMDTLTAFIGKPVYLYNAQVKYCTDTITRVLDTSLLDGVGIGFDWGETMTRSRDLAKPVTAWVEDTLAVNDHVDMSYTFRVDRTRTKVENLHTSTTISDATTTDIAPPNPYDSLSTIALSPTTSDTVIHVKNDPDPLLAPPTTNTATIAEPVLSGLTTSASGGTLVAATYYYTVSAYTGAGHTLISNEMNVATTGSTSTNTLTWGSVAGATGYRLWRGTATGVYDGYYDVGLVTTFDDTGVSVTSSSVPGSNTALITVPVLDAPTGHTTGGTLPADTYYTKITAYTADGGTIGSNEVSTTTTGTTSSITHTWTAVAGATGYKVWRGTVSNGQNINYDVGNVTSFTDNGSIATPMHDETIRTTTWVSYDDYICSIDNDFLDYELSGATDTSGGLDASSNILDPNVSNTFVPSHTGAGKDYFMVRYTYNDGTNDQWGFYTYQYGSGGNTDLDNIFNTGGIVGDFYPRIYCRLDGKRLDTNALKGTPAYVGMQKLCKKLGMDWVSLSTTLHENIGALGDVKQIVLAPCVPMNTTHDVEIEYLNKWFHKMFTVLPVAPYKKGVFSSIIPGAKKGQSVMIADNVYTQKFNIGGILSEEITGSIGAVGATAFSTETLGHRYDLQLTATTYRRVTVWQAVSYEYVSGGYVTSSQSASNNLVVPLDNSMFHSMTKRRSEELYSRAMRIIINTTKVIKTAWYATSVFQVIAFVAAVIINIVSAGASTPLTLALIASSIITVVAVSIVIQVVMALLVSLGVDPVIAAVIANVVGIFAGGKINSTGFSTAMTAANLLKMTSAALQLIAVGFQEEFKKTMQAMQDFAQFAKGKEAELEEAQKLLASTGYIYDPLYSPSTNNNEYFYRLGESPDGFIARTIATGNIGTGVFDYLTNYVSINLQLPDFQSTMQQITAARAAT